MHIPKKKKKVDYEALNSAFMRGGKLKVEAARALLNLGFNELYEINGRCPAALFEALQQKNLLPEEAKGFQHTHLKEGLALAVALAEADEMA